MLPDQTQPDPTQADPTQADQALVDWTPVDRTPAAPTSAGDRAGSTPPAQAGWLPGLRRSSIIRYAGLIGSIALAVDAYIFGALPRIRQHITPQSVATGHNGILIMSLWLLGTAALAGAWWFGRRLVGTGVLTARWTALTATLWMLPMLVIPPISSRDMYAYSCQGALFAAGGDPYHQGVSSLPCPWLDSVSVVWRDTPTPYGPLFIAMAGVASRLGSLTAAIIAFRILAVIGVAIIAISLPRLARRFGLPVDRVLWLVLASPLVVMHLIGGGHNDAITIGLLLAATAIVATRYDRLSGLIIGGALIGLSVAIKPTILVAVPFIALFTSGGADQPAPAPLRVGTVATASGPFGFPPVAAMVGRGGVLLLSAFVALLIPTLATGLGFGWVSALIHAGGEPSWTSPSTAIGTSIDALLSVFGVHVNVVPVTRTVGLAVLPVALVLIFLRARAGQRFYAAGIALLAVTFFAPIAQPWYLIWPLVMIAISPVRARWFAIAVVVASFAAMPDGVGLDGLLRLQLSIAMAIVAIYGLIRGVGWLRGAEPIPYPRTAQASDQRTDLSAQI